MCSSIDIGIDTQHGVRLIVQCVRKRRKLAAFFFGLDIELPNTRFQRADDFFGCFANARKHNVLCRDARSKGAVHFAARHNICAIALTREHLEHSQIRVGFYGKGQMRVIKARQCVAEHLRVPLQRCA